MQENNSFHIFGNKIRKGNKMKTRLQKFKVNFKEFMCLDQEFRNALRNLGCTACEILYQARATRREFIKTKLFCNTK